MFFHVPIVARAAAVIDRLVRDTQLLQAIISAQDRCLLDFQYPVVRDRLLHWLQSFADAVS